MDSLLGATIGTLLLVVAVATGAVAAYVFLRQRLAVVGRTASVEAERTRALLDEQQCHHVELNSAATHVQKGTGLQFWRLEASSNGTEGHIMRDRGHALPEHWQPFSDLPLMEVVAQGITEKWLIKPDNISVDLGPRARGGFAEVRKGKLFNLSDVAVKVAKKLEQPLEGHALTDEWKALRKLRHQNIVLFHGILLLGERNTPLLCPVLEWIEGQDLGMYIWQRFGHKPQVNTGGWMDPDDELSNPTHSNGGTTLAEQNLLIDVCRGMQYLHNLQTPVLHRDLKPGNILVETITEPPRAKIADFGMSMSLTGHAWMKRAGTRAYVAPEVARGEAATVASDVYSFGCVCAFALYAEHPSPESVKEQCQQKAMDGAAWVTSVAAIALTCLHEDARFRANFAELYDRLLISAAPEVGTKSFVLREAEDFRDLRRGSV
mmetsp:Transcript_31346/g.71567  ORF Transcript_31346/g.71567 Transcript_31346/m.71567 type:complete len:434 (-) Transcript_31346:75-1376(-)